MPAVAQDRYANRPVSIVVPFPAGGVVDMVARTVGQISSGPLVLVTGSKVPATDVPQLMQYLKVLGVRAFYGSNGNGTFPHLAAELFKQANQLPSAHIPYSGGPGALTALIAGDIAYSINHIPVGQGMVKSAKLRALATAGKKRSVAFPELPTLDELGMKGFEANAWWGLFAPTGTPPEIVQALSQALELALKDPAVRTTLEAQGDEVSFSTPKEFPAFVNAQSTAWTKVVKTADLRLD